MPTPGVQSQMLGKSGGNKFQGEIYQDFENNSMIGENIENNLPAKFLFSPTNTGGIRLHSNETQKYRDSNINVGGPIKKDKVWWYFSYRNQKTSVGQPNFIGPINGTFFDTKLWNPSGKTTYQINQNNKLIGYYQWGQKIQPNRTQGGVTVTKIDSPDYTNYQDSGSWVYKGEWNSTVSDKLYLEARYGDFGYSFPLVTNSDADYFFYETNQFTEGAHQKQQLDRDRKQYNFASTYFVDTGKGNHTVKFGAEMLKELSWEGYESRRGGASNIEVRYNNGAPDRVIFGLPTATCAVGSLAAHSCLTSIAALDTIGLFVNDTWAIGRASVNAGVRYDRYKGWLPEQEQIGATIGRASVPARTFDETDLFAWNLFAPRIGVVFDLSGNGKTVVKGNYGLYWHNPGATVSGNANPNIADKSSTWSWNDANGDRRWQPGEETTLITESLQGAIQLDPDISAPWTHEASGWVEHQVTDTMGVRAGYVYKTEDNLITPNNYQTLRGPEAYTAPFTFIDNGVDGVRGTADDRNIPMLGFPTANAAQFPATIIVSNVPQYSRYKTIEASLNKRYGNKWSGSMGGNYTMMKDFPNNYPQNPNQPGVEDRSTWSFKATASYDAKWGIRLSPVLRHQSGVNFGRNLSIPAAPAAGISVSGALAYAEPANANREDNITVLDVRAEKNIQVTHRLKLRTYLDLFNITNSHASETISRTTGLQYLKPTAILAPFTARVGFRVIF